MNDPAPGPFDLRAWLNGLGLGEYADALEAQDINRETMLELTQEDLKECGIVSMGHRKALLLAIQDLKTKQVSSPSGPPSPPAVVSVAPAASLPAGTPATVVSTEPVAAEAHAWSEGRPEATGAEEVSALLHREPEALSPSAPPSVSQEHPPAGMEKEEKPPLLKRFAAAYRKASGGSLLLSIAVHAVILLIGTYLVVSQIVEERKISFGGGEAGPKQEAQHKVKRKTTTTAPAPTKRITTTSSIAKVALPDMPDIPTNMGPSIAGAMGSGGFGASGGLGGGGNGGGGMGGGKGTGFSKITFFGLRGGKNDSLMKGMFYDLKQTKDKKPTDIATDRGAYWRVVKDFVGRQNWSPDVLDKYYHPDAALYSPRVFVPVGVSTEAPKAFGVERDVKDDRWVVHYRGRMRALKDGMFRFIGCGDNLLVVRLNKRNFFDGSMDGRRGGLINPALTSITKQPPETFGNVCAAGWELGASEWFQASRGQTFDIEVLIGDCGGFFSAFLLIEEKGIVYGKSRDGKSQIYPAFQVDTTRMPPISSPKNLKEFNPDVAPPAALFEGVPSGL